MHRFPWLDRVKVDPRIKSKAAEDMMEKCHWDFSTLHSDRTDPNNVVVFSKKNMQNKSQRGNQDIKSSEVANVYENSQSLYGSGRLGGGKEGRNEKMIEKQRHPPALVFPPQQQMRPTRTQCTSPRFNIIDRLGKKSYPSYGLRQTGDERSSFEFELSTSHTTQIVMGSGAGGAFKGRERNIKWRQYAS
jgi:hypothetical protein